MSYTSLLFGDVVLVRFPFTDQATLKKRPAVVVSSAAYNRAKPDLILMAVTRVFRPVPTLEQGLIPRQLGALAPNDLPALRLSLSQILG